MVLDEARKKAELAEAKEAMGTRPMTRPRRGRKRGGHF